MTAAHLARVEQMSISRCRLSGGLTIEDRDALTALLAERSALREALLRIANLGGNLPDECFTDVTGPRDAAYRGMLYCNARAQARTALGETA